MKFSVCNELFENWDLEKVFEFVSSIGYDGVEIAPFTLADSVTEISQDQRKQIRQKAEQYGVEVVGLHWLLVKPEGLYLNHPDDGVRNRTRDYLLELIRFCGDLGGKTMVVGSPKQRNVIEGLSYQRAWELTKRTLADCVELAHERNVILCFEALPQSETNFINTAEEAVKLVREINHPNFRLMLDVKAMCSEKKPIPQIIEENRKYLVHVHANDANRRGPGFGDVDFVPIAEALKRIGYAGYVSVEVFDFRPDPETIARKSLEYLQRCFL